MLATISPTPNQVSQYGLPLGDPKSPKLKISEPTQSSQPVHWEAPWSDGETFHRATANTFWSCLLAFVCAFASSFLGCEEQFESDVCSDKHSWWLLLGDSLLLWWAVGGLPHVCADTHPNVPTMSCEYSKTAATFKKLIGFWIICIFYSVPTKDRERGGNLLMFQEIYDTLCFPSCLPQTSPPRAELICSAKSRQLLRTLGNCLGLTLFYSGSALWFGNGHFQKTSKAISGFAVTIGTLKIKSA